MTFRAVDQGEAAQADFVQCARMADLVPISRLKKDVQREAAAARQASTRQPCEGCGETILVSDTAPPGVPRICTHCHAKVKAIANRAQGPRA